MHPPNSIPSKLHHYEQLDCLHLGLDLLTQSLEVIHIGRLALPDDAEALLFGWLRDLGHS